MISAADIKGWGAKALSRAAIARRDPTTQILVVDVLAVLVALALPWSTSGVAIFISLWAIALVPTINVHEFLRSLTRWICILPIAIFFLAAVGTLWSDVAWADRLRAISPTAKLLVLPLMLYHFERSKKGKWVAAAFLISCVPLMIVSLAVAFDPALTLKPVGYRDFGIFVKDRIAQSQEFSLCALGLGYPIFVLWQRKKVALAVLLSIVALGLIASMAFVAISRTTFVVMPAMLLVALYYSNRAMMVRTLCLLPILGGIIWFSSPLLRSKAASISSQYSEYKNLNEPTSVGSRLEFWRKSLSFFEKAPFIGHGTGSVRRLFEQAVIGQRGASAEVIGNPHNQTLYMAIQWGVLGISLLYAMWLVHLLLFRGRAFANWIGLLVVTQNLASSLFNSHLFDFHEGWMYVLGVGVAGGMALRKDGNVQLVGDDQGVKGL